MEKIDYYVIRDECIPKGDVKKLDELLKKELNEKEVEELLGTAMFYRQKSLVDIIIDYAISKRIIFSKLKVVQNIYYSECREKSRQNPQMMIEPIIFNETFIKKYLKIYNSFE